MMNIVNRRNTMRYAVCLNANVITQDGSSYSVKISDISTSGLCFVLKSEYLPQVVPTNIQKNNLSPISIELDIELGELVAKIKIQCGIVYVQRKSLDLSTVGCRFESFIENASERLEQYLVDLSNQSDIKIDHIEKTQS